MAYQGYQGGYQQGGYQQANYPQGNYPQGNYQQGNYQQGNYQQGNYQQGNQGSYGSAYNQNGKGFGMKGASTFGTGYQTPAAAPLAGRGGYGQQYGGPSYPSTPKPMAASNPWGAPAAAKPPNPWNAPKPAAMTNPWGQMAPRPAAVAKPAWSPQPQSMARPMGQVGRPPFQATSRPGMVPTGPRMIPRSPAAALGAAARLPVRPGVGRIGTMPVPKPGFPQPVAAKPAAKLGAVAIKPPAKPAAKPAADAKPAAKAPAVDPKEVLAQIVAKAAKAKAARSAQQLEQYSKMELASWALGHRPVADLLWRFPSLRLAPDLIETKCHFVEESWRGRVPLHPLKETLTLDESKDRLMDEDVQLPGQATRIVRVALLACRQTPNPTHMASQIQFVLHKTTSGPATLPGGPWDPSKDGKDSESAATLKKTAVRILKEIYALDLSRCDFHRFMDLYSRTEEGEEIHTTVLLPNVWKLDKLPLGLGRIVKEVEKEVVRQETVEEPLTDEEKEKLAEQWKEHIARQRAEGQKERLGEKEVDRFERLEKLEVTLREMEKVRPTKDTKSVTKEVKETKVIKQELSKPAFLSLQTLLELSQLVKEGPVVNAVFENKLFALCFDEMIRLESSLKILDYVEEFKGRAEELKEMEEKKNKRNLDQIQERNKLVQDRLAKRQKLEQEKKKADEFQAKVSELREAERLELEQMEKERREKEGLDGDPDAPLPPLRLTKLVYDLDDEKAQPFLYFDCSMQAPSGHMARTDLLQVFHRTGTKCKREIEQLLKVTIIEPPVKTKAGAGLFEYRVLCSTPREVEEEPAPEAPAAKEGDAKEVKAEAMEEDAPK